MMTVADMIFFIKENPNTAVIFLFILVLVIYQEHVQEMMKHPEKKDKKRIPKFSIASADKASGIIFGKKGKKLYCSKASKEGHVFVCAASGAGKTTAIAIPSIRAFCRKEAEQKRFFRIPLLKQAKPNTCFVIDISGDIEPNCDISNKLVWDVEDPTSIPYNILAPIDAEKDPQKQNELLQKLAFIVLPDCAPEGTVTKWFDDSGRSILTGAFIYYYHQGLDFVEICQKIESLGIFELFQEITDSEDEAAIMYIARFDRTNEQNTAGCKKSVDDAISIFATHSIMQHIIRRPRGDEPTITPALLEEYSLFLKVPDADTDIYGPVLGIITSQTFNYCAKRKNYRRPHILFVLDEFASLQIGQTAILNCSRKYRKKNIRLMILTQALTDIDILYGKEIRESILGNIKFKVILGITDPKSQQYFADIIGMRDYRVKSISFSHGATNTTYSVRRDYRVPPEEFGRLGDELYVIGNDASYIRLEKNYYFK